MLRERWVYAYIAGTPFAYISYYHGPAQAYGWLFCSVIAGIMGVNMVNTRLVTKLGSDRLLRLGTIGTAGFGIAVALAIGIGCLLSARLSPRAAQRALIDAPFLQPRKLIGCIVT